MHPLKNLVNQKFNLSQIVISGAYVKVRECLNTQVLFIIGTMILNHIDTRAIFHGYEGSYA